MRVFIYWNLHRECWSIKALEGPSKGRVIAHASAWAISHGVQFKVSGAGRQRVLREQRKNVHAGVVGDLEAWVSIHTASGAGPLEHLHRPSVFERENLDACNAQPFVWQVTYNPYKGPTFITRENGEPITGARAAWAEGRDVRALTNTRRPA